MYVIINDTSEEVDNENNPVINPITLSEKPTTEQMEKQCQQ
jgi:hypothetical protein